MELEKLEATIEAVLFAMGNAVSVEKIATAIGHDTETTRKLVHQMMDRYNQREGGLEIIELDDAFQLCTRREYYDALIRVAKQPKKYVLTDVQLEVLSIVAYKQPVTRQEVEKIRGVNSDHALNRLVEYGKTGCSWKTDPFWNNGGISQKFRCAFHGRTSVHSAGSGRRDEVGGRRRGAAETEPVRLADRVLNSDKFLRID